MDVMCIGGIFIDHLFHVVRVPKAEEDLMAQGYRKSLGGCAANVAIGTSLLGLSSSIISVIGNDEESNNSVNKLQKAGVSTEYIRMIPDEQMGVCLSMIDEKNGQPTYLSYLGAIRHFNANLLPLDWGNKAEFLYVSAYDLILPQNKEAVLQSIMESKCGGGKLLFDFCPYFIEATDNLVYDEILQYADVITGSEQEVEKLVASYYGTGNPDSQIEKWIERRLEEGTLSVHIKRGNKGSTAYNQSGKFDHPAYTGPIIDTTGAGDAYVSALLYSLINNFSMQQTLQLCNLYAYLACTQLSATAGLLTIQKMKEKGYPIPMASL